MPEIKERNLEISPNTAENKTGIVDVGQDNIGKEPVPRDIKTWIEKVEQASIPQSNTINDDGQVTPINLSNQESPVTLPLTKKTFVVGFKKTWLDAGRWLSSFWLRFIKIKKGNVTFKSHDTD